MLRLGELIIFKPRLGGRKWGEPVFAFIWRGGFYRFWQRDHKGSLIKFEKTWTNLTAEMFGL